MAGNIKTIQEHLAIDLFRMLYPDFPGGKLRKSESPDFILQTSRKISTGIEITRLLPDSAHPKIKTPQKKRDVQNQVTQEVENHYRYFEGMPVWAEIYYNKELTIPKNQVRPYAQCITSMLFRRMLGRRPGDIFPLRVEKGLPEGTDIVLLYHHHLFQKIRFESKEGYQIPDLHAETLQSALQPKEKKLPLYQSGNHDQYWLIVVIDWLDRTMGLNIDNKIGKWDIRTDFDKLFLLDMGNSKLYTLK
ncbi:MAG: hypothetical protein R6T99_05325 [Bacteroidales bacterium]